MIVQREMEIADFKKQKYYVAHILIDGIDAVSERMDSKEDAEGIAKSCKGNPVTVKSYVSEHKKSAPPKLYDLTSLQMDASRLFGFTANVVNDKKVTDHHAIIPTMEIEKADIKGLPEAERKILFLVADRLIAATAEPMGYQAVKAEFECEGSIFKASGKTVLKRYTESSLLSQMERAGNKDMNDGARRPVDVGFARTGVATETVERKGLGTTATRADIIEKIISQGYVKREKKTLVPTEDGMKLITVLPDEIKSVQMTVDMENTLAGVAAGTVTDTSYLDQIIEFVKRVVGMYSSISGENRNLFSASKEKIGGCPFCGGEVVKGKYGIYCEKKCGMRFGKIMGKQPTDSQWKDILAGKRVLLKNLKSKSKGSVYDAYFTPETIEDFTYTDKDGREHYGKQFRFKMEFPQKKE